MKTEILLLFLGEFFVKATAVLLLAALIAWVWRGASAAQRHLVWLAAIIIVLLLPTTRLVTPRWRVPVERPAAVEAHVGMASQAVVSSEAIPPFFAPPAKPSRRSPAWAIPDWSSILVAAWLAGCVGWMGYRFLGLWRLRRLEQRGMSPAGSRVEAMAMAVLDEMGIERPVRMRLCEECRVPMTWGFWRPMLVLPTEALEWSDTRLAAALRHEAGHIGRWDYSARWIAHLACAVYWPNPLVWLAARSLRIAQEQATDDLVLRAGTPPEDYAAQLFDSARAVAAHGVFARHAVAMATPSTLENRVLAIVDEQRNRRPLSALAVAAGSLTTLLALGLCAAAQLQAAEPGGAGSTPVTGAPPPAGPPERPSPPASPGEGMKKAEAIVLPIVEFREATVGEAVDFFRAKSLELDPQRLGVNIVLDPGFLSDARITVSFTSIPLSEALRYLAGLADLELRDEPGALVLAKAASVVRTATIPDPFSRSALEIARLVVLPKVEFRNLPFGDMMSFLTAKSKELDPKGQGTIVSTVLSPLDTAEIHRRRMTLSLADVTLLEVLDKVCGLTGLELRATPNALLLDLPKIAARADAAVKPAAAPPIELTGDRVTHEKDGFVTAEGHAEVRSGASTLKAEKVRFKEQSRWVEASGKVEVTQGNNVVTGENLSVGFRENGGLSFVGPHKTTIKIEVGIPIPGKAGFVRSPFAPDAGEVDVREFKPGAEVKCPYTGSLFVVPAF